MKYYYEYHYTSGITMGGHNLEKISIKDNKIILEGIDCIQTTNGEINDYWKTIIDADKIEYLKIEPMEEEYE